MSNTITLRHDLDALRVSLLAEASYCEQKAALSVIHPEAERESEAMCAGTAAHSALEDEAEKIGRDELERRLAAGEAVSLREFLLEAEISGVRLRGQIDQLELTGRRALWLYDFKFSRYAQRLFPNYRLQLSLYGLLLAAGGFDISELICAAIIVPPQRRNQGRLIETSPALANHAIRLSKQLRGDKGGVRGGGRLLEPGCAIHAFAFSEREARRDFAESLGYWIGEREARAADSAAKCRSCPYNLQGLCPVALEPPAP
jgi:CRISPR/Cas system-associated exonuclease Cas4 (RecB family)